MTSTQTVDGRSARAQRTRESVVDAVLELVGTGQTRPTAREIADAAGISVRSVYVHFDDLDDLFRAAADRHFEKMASLLEPVDAALPIAERISASTDQRIQIHERFGAVRRAAEQWAPHSPALAEVLRQGRAVGRQDIERLFGGELVGRADHDATLSAITLLLGAEAWDSLRSQGLSVTAAREVIVHTVTRLIERG
jgi:AcrR family transcriptional regulator